MLAWIGSTFEPTVTRSGSHEISFTEGVGFFLPYVVQGFLNNTDPFPRLLGKYDLMFFLILCR